MKKIGLVGLSTNETAWVSKVIRFFRKPFTKEWIPSHCFVVFGKINNELIVGESTNPKIRLYPLFKFLFPAKKVELWHIDIDQAQKRQAITNLLPLCGDSYGYKQLLGFIWVWIGKRLGLNWDNPVKAKDLIVCSDYVWYYLRDIGFGGKLINMKPDNVAPDTIREHFLNDPRCELVATCEYGESELKWKR